MMQLSSPRLDWKPPLSASTGSPAYLSLLSWTRLSLRYKFTLGYHVKSQQAAPTPENDLQRRRLPVRHAHVPLALPGMTTDSTRTSPSLPYPVSATRRRPSHSYVPRRSPSLVGGSWSLLTQRTARSSPVTLLLLGLLCFSLLGNLRAAWSGTVSPRLQYPWKRG